MKHTLSGTISLSLATVGSILIATVTGLAAYFGTVNVQAQKVADTKEQIYQDISVDRQRITVVETDMKTMKDSQIRVESKVDELLRRVK